MIQLVLLLSFLWQSAFSLETQQERYEVSKSATELSHEFSVGYHQKDPERRSPGPAFPSQRGEEVDESDSENDDIKVRSATNTSEGFFLFSWTCIYFFSSPLDTLSTRIPSVCPKFILFRNLRL